MFWNLLLHISGGSAINNFLIFNEFPNKVMWFKACCFELVQRGTEVDLGGLGVTCSPRDLRFAGSNPAEVDDFFQDVKILSTSPPGETLSWGVPSLRIQAR